ncbi:hypothetical protein MNBD_GAMMA07-1012 [hydrothermal vent metagenome]|uniref:Cohesin domain-containing protein n=1 Tax=hydrothermal vent metagenome TaxID=652676 RepID=A0A3B0WIS9_9ZZZZ
MKKTLFFILSLIFIYPQSMLASIISVTPENSVVQPGELFSVDIIGQEFSDSTDGGGINVQYDSNIIQVESFSFDPLWEFFSDAGTIDNIGGAILNIGFATFINTPPEDFVIGTLLFRAGETLGDTSISLTESLAVGGFSVGGVKQTVDFSAGQVAVIPLPASAMLLLSGLSFFGLSFRRN